MFSSHSRADWNNRKRNDRNGELGHCHIPEPLRKGLLKTETQQIITTPSASSPEAFHTPDGVSRQRMNDSPRSCSHFCSGHQDISWFESLQEALKSQFILMRKRNVPGMPNFLHSYILQVLKIKGKLSQGDYSYLEFGAKCAISSFYMSCYLNPCTKGELRPKECQKHRKSPETTKAQILRPSLCPSAEPAIKPTGAHQAPEIQARIQTPLTQFPTTSFAPCWSNPYLAGLTEYLSQKHCK